MARSFLSRRWLINYVLLVLVVVFTYIGNYYNVETGYQPKNTISSLKAKDVTQLGIQTADFNMSLNKMGSQWFIESPQQWPANNISIERLLSLLSTGTDSRLPAEEIDLSSIGLEFPGAILSFNDSVFHFGSTNNIGKRRYIRSDNTIFLMPDNHYPLFIQGLSSIVDRRLLPRSIALERLQLSPFDLSPGIDGLWQDADRGADPEQLTRLVKNWQTLEAGAIKPYDKNASPRQKITATSEYFGRTEFFLMAIQPEIVIARPDLGYQFHFSRKRYYDLLAVKTRESGD